MEITILELLKKFPNSTLRRYEGVVSVQNSKAVIFTDLTLDEYQEVKEEEIPFFLEKLPSQKGKKVKGSKPRTAYRLQLQA